MHEKHGAYYYVHRNKWTRIGSDYAEAIKKYSLLIIEKKSGDLPEFISRSLIGKKLAANTIKAYALAAEKLRIAFEEFDPEDFRPTHFYQWIAAKQITDSMAQLYRSVMVSALALAIKEGRIDVNPMREVQNWKGKARRRYITNAEYLLVKKNACPTLQAIIAISLQTGQRIGDVLKITYSDLTEDGIYIEQEKSQGENRLCIAWTPDLRDAVAVAKTLHTSIKGMTLFSTRQGKPIPYSTVRDWWISATTKAGLDYHSIHMHDISAKTGTDARKQWLDSKSLLGHRSDSAHNRYQRSVEIPVVQPLPMVKS